ncbi:unnamed protein product [Trichogramma brassicae]|uniref:Uncharacterized protein n=1 Tax=Trichogramma brassicae TaxID=86971 RepID=A0A6H5IBA1_9HYME|nr:unnamed protein product [Trichogramma brassicae]
MVFGTSLRIPGELMMQQDTDKTPPSDFVLALRRLFKAIRPVPASRHAQHHRPFVFADLATCDYVFRRSTASESRSSSHTPGHTKSSDVSTRGLSSSTSTVSRRHSPLINSSRRISTTQIHSRSLISRRPRGRHRSRTTHSTQQRRGSDFHTPAQNAQSIGRGVAVAPGNSSPVTRRSRRQLGLPPNERDS